MKHNSLILTFKILVVGVSLFSQTVNAEDRDSDRGRLSDGRAFRTDVDGSQLVDYIAELEMGMLELSRKVQSLEEENSRVSSELLRVKDGRPEGLSEKDLLNSKSNANKDVSKDNWKHEVENLKECPPQNECPKLECPLIEAADMNCPDPEVQYQAVSDPEDRKKINNLREEVSRIESELLKTRRERDHLLSRLQVSAIEAKDCKLKAENEIRARMKPDIETSRVQAVDLIRERLQKEHQLLINRKDQRDLLFSKHIQEYKGVTLRPSSLRARSGHDLKQIGELLSKAGTVRELALIRNDLEEIRRQLADDLALVERLGH